MPDSKLGNGQVCCCYFFFSLIIFIFKSNFTVQRIIEIIEHFFAILNGHTTKEWLQSQCLPIKIM